MLLQLALAFGLVAQAPETEPEVVESPRPSGYVPYETEGSAQPGIGYPGHLVRIFPPSVYHHPECFINGQYFKSTLDMPLHLPYPTAPMSYYYFRPYSYLHIPAQQAEVMRWGGDPRHPYDNKVFEMVYEKLDVKAGVWEPGLSEPLEPVEPPAAPEGDELPTPDAPQPMGRLPELRFESDEQYFDAEEQQAKTFVFPVLTAPRRITPVAESSRSTASPESSGPSLRFRAARSDQR